MTAAELKRWRTARGLTTTQAAARAMVGVRSWQLWESGRRQIPAHRVRLLKSSTQRAKAQEKGRDQVHQS